MKDYLQFNDEDLTAFIKQHKGTIHTREFPSRCGTCRFISRFEAAEKIVKETQRQMKSCGHENCCELCELETAWRMIAGK
jgi:hypothetical protein